MAESNNNNYSLKNNEILEKAKDDVEIQSRIIEENENFIIYCIRKYIGNISDRQNPAFEKQDYIQAGRIGMYKAINNFDVSMGYSFTTYCAKRIVGEIHNMVRDYGYLVKIPRSTYLLNKKIRKFRNQGLKDKTIAKKLDVNVNEVVKIKLFTNLCDLYGVIEAPHNNDNDKLLIDLIEDGEPYIEDTVSSEEYVEYIIKDLDDIEKHIVVDYVINNVSQKELAEIHNVSQPRISKILHSALEKIKYKILEEGDY